MELDDVLALLKDDPSDELLGITAAQKLLAVGRRTEALPILESLVAAKPDFVLAWGYLARLKLDLGDREGARKAVLFALPEARRQDHEVPIAELEAVEQDLESDF